MHRPGVELAIFRSLVRRPTTTLPSQPGKCTRKRFCRSYFNLSLLRRLFPTLRVRVAGLMKLCNYVLLVDVVPVDQFRYRYEYSTWFIAGTDYTRSSPPHGVAASTNSVPETVPAGQGTSDQIQTDRHRFYVHPDSPATGKHWMRQTAISFHRLKLTNNIQDQHGNV